eukprot:CAMPEP_0206274048 /NCGR_PEP_ID=MMETSP0047_2-20121206/34938_1 /ASSEMBLY_ACC=CAM_ASM_000192 /TAXON_ID=195065 /ORGANISM="Chroomonas mesostigmatica_cf, Strain CCMP1168" /LENGTH=93 /DNA_ID=CAMNT_0053703219 /DNA_START=205 /DNA_END=483 /DNA_ORIENTATION=-
MAHKDVARIDITVIHMMLIRKRHSPGKHSPPPNRLFRVLGVPERVKVSWSLKQIHHNPCFLSAHSKHPWDLGGRIGGGIEPGERHVLIVQKEL